jgi:hypothetical protein
MAGGNFSREDMRLKSRLNLLSVGQRWEVHALEQLDRGGIFARVLETSSFAP